MAKAKTIDTNEDIKKLVASEKAIIGTKMTLKALKSGKLVRIYLAKNVSEETKNDIDAYSKISKIELVELPVKNDELGVICRKPYSISVLGEQK